MRKRTAVVALLVGAFAVLAVGSYATADSGKKNVNAGTMSGYLEGPRAGLSRHWQRGRSRRPLTTRASSTRSSTRVSGATSRRLTSTSATGAPMAESPRGCAERLRSPGPAGTPACEEARQGVITGPIEAADVVGPSGQGILAGEFAELVAAMRAGKAYANVHSATFGGGEIRGQINDDNQRDD